MPQCDECGRSVKKFIKTINQINSVIHVMYGYLKNGNVHPAEVWLDYINMIIWQFARNVKTIGHVFVVKELIIP